MDLYFDETGDIAIATNGDIEMTPTSWRDQVQQAYIRIMTDVGDYVLYPTLGANLSSLYGMQQTPTTGSFGASLISNALTEGNAFNNTQITVNAVPTDYQAIRFDVSIKSGSMRTILLSVEQNLNLI